MHVLGILCSHHSFSLCMRIIIFVSALFFEKINKLTVVIVSTFQVSIVVI